MSSLYAQICDWSNLLLAWRKARKGKRRRAPAATFEENVLAQRIHQQAFAFQDALTAAGLDQRNRRAHLLQADIQLSGLRKTLLLCNEMGLLEDGPYRHVSEMVMTAGKLLGGWRRSVSM